MGNKSSARALRLGISQNHDANWYVEPQFFAKTLLEDIRLREYLESHLKAAGVARIEISRSRDFVEITITCLKPSVIVGRKGSEIDVLSKTLGTMLGKTVRLKIFDVKRPDTNAVIVAKNIANEVSRKGVSCRRVIKRYVQNAMRGGALGIRIEVSGRLSGAEIARREWYQEGAVPRQKFRANIEYKNEHSYASWGVCGVKVWVYKGDVLSPVPVQRSNERNGNNQRGRK